MAYGLAIDLTRNGNDLLPTGITCYSLMIVLLYLSVIGIPLVSMVCCKTEHSNQCCVCSTVTTDHWEGGGAPNIVLVANAVGLVASCYVDLYCVC